MILDPKLLSRAVELYASLPKNVDWYRIWSALEGCFEEAMDAAVVAWWLSRRDITCQEDVATAMMKLDRKEIEAFLQWAKKLAEHSDELVKFGEEIDQYIQE